MKFSMTAAATHKSRTRLSLFSGMALLSLALASSAGAFVPPNTANIDTTGSWNGTYSVTNWGVPNTATYGQTITATVLQNNLQNFTFYLQNYGSNTSQYQAFVYQWNGSQITGSALYSSGTLTAPGSGGFQAVTINTGGTVLTAGQQYVVFLTTSTIGSQPSSNYAWGLVGDTAYKGGNFVYMNNGTTFSNLSSQNWYSFSYDLATIIRFTPVSLSPITAGQGNTVALGAAAVIDKNPELYSLFGNAFLATARDVSNAVSQTLPLMTGGSMLATESALSTINGVIQTRIDVNRGMSSGDGFVSDKYLWVKPFGSHANQDDQGSVPGYTSDTFGVVAGVDGKLSDAFRLGGALAFAKVNLDSQSSVAPQNSDINVYQVIAYGRYDVDSTVGVNFQANAGLNTNQGSRQITFASAVASSDYDSQDIHLGVDINKSFSLGAKTKLIPSLRADYTWINDASYTETGADLLNLHVNSRSTDALVIGPDVRLTHSLSDQISLMGNLGVGYDTINNQASITSAFAGAPGAAFVTYGIDPSPWLGRGGLGFISKGEDGVEITGRYDAEYRTEYLNQTVSVQLRWAF